MTPAAPGAAADRELMAAARMGVDPADSMTDPADQPPVPTFDAYIPEVEKAVSLGTAETYDRPTPTTSPRPTHPDRVPDNPPPHTRPDKHQTPTVNRSLGSPLLVII